MPYAEIKDNKIVGTSNNKSERFSTEIDGHDVHNFVVQDGKCIRIDTGNYILDRAKKYPALPEQLDALWHAMDQGILPQVSGFYDIIKTVKNKHPKKAGE